MSFELSKAAQKIGQEVGDEAGRKLDALLGAGAADKTPMPEASKHPGGAYKGEAETASKVAARKEKSPVLSAGEPEAEEKRGWGLSQEEVDALLRGISSDREPVEPVAAQAEASTKKAELNPADLGAKEQKSGEGDEEQVKLLNEQLDGFISQASAERDRAIGLSEKLGRVSPEDHKAYNIEKECGDLIEEFTQLENSSDRPDGDIGALKGLAEKWGGLYYRLYGYNTTLEKLIERASAGEAAGKKETAPEKSGAGEKSPIEVAEVEKLPKREFKEGEAEAMLAKAREEYVMAEQAKVGAEKEEDKFTGLKARIKEFIVGGFTSHETDKERIPARQERIAAVQEEAYEARERFIKASENLRASIRTYRDEEISKIDKKAAELKTAGKTEEEIKKETEKYARDILLATTLRESAKVYGLKADKQIEQMGKGRRLINEKAEQFTGWYKDLPLKGKLAVSGGLMVAGVAGGVLGSTAILTSALIGQTALRVLGGSMTTAGVERFAKALEEKEEIRSLDKEFGGKFLEALKNQSAELDERMFKMVKSEQTRKNVRFAVAGIAGGIVGGGVLASAIKETFNWGGGKSAVEALKGGFNPKGVVPLPSVEDELRGRWPSEAVKGPAVSGTEKPVAGAGPDVSASKGSGLPGAEESPSAVDHSPLEEPPGSEKLPEGAAVGEELKEPGVKEPVSLKIGARGPEGAIIDNFRANPELAKSFGWDGKTDISKWAGTKAHQMWLQSVNEELAKPGMAEKLTSQGFTADAEGYAKAMHKIGKGFVEIQPSGEVRLTDDTVFLKAGTPAVEGSGGAIETPTPGIGTGESTVPDTSESSSAEPATKELPSEKPTKPVSEAPTEPPAEAPGEDELLDKKIKDTVKAFVDPAILTDKTFKAAGKLTLGKILEEIPEEIYKNKHSLADYWHNLGVNAPDLPGTGFLGELSYDDVRKYSEMSKFLRENPVMKSVVGLKNMTVEEFLKIYGTGLGKK